MHKNNLVSFLRIQILGLCVLRRFCGVRWEVGFVLLSSFGDDSDEQLGFETCMFNPN